jgi:hypothetical protein
MSNLSVFFHKDFDGFVAAAFFLRINEASQLIGAAGVTLNPVDYGLKAQWLKTPLLAPNVVIDFLYHPQADWWFDHHVSTFLNKRHELKYKNSEKQIWDVNSPSCAALIKRHLSNYNSLFLDGEAFERIVENFSEWIQWSDIIDNAKFDNPGQAVELSHPCLKINATLASEVNDEYFHYLVMATKMYSPAEVACLEPVKRKIDDVMMAREKNMFVFKNKLEILPGDIAFFDYVKNKISFQRYLAFYFRPDVRYSLGLYQRGATVYSLSVGKNPWQDFASINIGDICRKFGGGGRINVGSISFPNYAKALKSAAAICESLAENC